MSRKLLLSMVVGTLIIGIIGCARKEEASKPDKKAEMVIEEKVKDPVCGMNIYKEQGIKTEYEGVTYYFCSENCRDDFLKGPRKYIKKP